MAAGIPVLAYNADAAGTRRRLAYIGQDLFVPGQVGQHILSSCPRATVALFIATPGTANIQPRIDGAQATLTTPASRRTWSRPGAGLTQEYDKIDAWYHRQQGLQGMMAVDSGDSNAVGAVDPEARGSERQGRAWSATSTPITQADHWLGHVQFTIDQQPYLQGFLPILQLYLYNVTGLG